MAKTRTRIHALRWLGFVAITAIVSPEPLVATGGGMYQGPERAELKAAIQELAVIQVRHEDALFDLPGVHGVGVTVDPGTRELMFLVVTDREDAVNQIPQEIEGVKAVAEVRERAELLDGGSGCIPCHADQQPLPVQMGNSTGNPFYCSACTLGFKACRLGEHYYVTNAHCSWDEAGCEGGAPLGSDTLHVGMLDASPTCSITTTIGEVAEHATPVCGQDNKVDAALIRSSHALTSWAIRDIGTPSTSPAWVVPSDPVQKSGRTTGETFGTVAATNYTADVGPFCCGSARFREQILVDANVAPFFMGGDSGSALLMGSAVAGLLFAGEIQQGTFAIANRIHNVIEALNLCGANCWADYMDCLHICPPGCPEVCEEQLAQCCHSTGLDPNCEGW